MVNLENDIAESTKGYTIKINNLNYKDVERPIRREENLTSIMQPKTTEQPRKKIVLQKIEPKG